VHVSTNIATIFSDLIVIYSGFWLLLVIHEAGHPIAGCLLGYGVIRVRLGEGNVRLTFVFGHCSLSIAVWPSRGDFH